MRKLHEISSSFAVDYDDSFTDVFGALDGLTIRIRSPIDVPNPGNYFLQKTIYTLNMQAVCDRNNKLLWISPRHCGSSHDSSAFFRPIYMMFYWIW